MGGGVFFFSADGFSSSSSSGASGSGSEATMASRVLSGDHSKLDTPPL